MLWAMHQDMTHSSDRSLQQPGSSETKNLLSSDCRKNGSGNYHIFCVSLFRMPPFRPFTIVFRCIQHVLFWMTRGARDLGNSHESTSSKQLVGGFNHLEKYDSQWELSHILWKIKHVPNHQPDFYMSDLSWQPFHQLKELTAFA